jgi:3-phosphoshikimate 1-carboxyvinyltransferase
MAEYRVKRGKPIAAEISVPGDKSISHRAVMLASLSNGPCLVNGFLCSEDCLATVECFRRLGIKIEALDEEGNPWIGPTRLLIHGRGGKLEEPRDALYCGNSGTTMRLISGILAAQPFTSRLTGDDSLTRRPMKRIMEPLNAMGAEIVSENDNGTAPLVIHGGKLRPIRYSLPVASAQVKSAVLLAGMFTEGKTTVVEPQATRDHTETMLRHFGVKTLRDGKNVSIYGGQVPESQDLAGGCCGPAGSGTHHKERGIEPHPDRHSQSAAADGGSDHRGGHKQWTGRTHGECDGERRRIAWHHHRRG